MRLAGVLLQVCQDVAVQTQRGGVGKLCDESVFDFASEVARISAECERRAREVPADFYALNRPANLLFHQQELRACIGLLDRARLFPLSGLRVADIGCGCGNWLLEFVQWGAEPTALCGIDLSAGRIDRVRRRLPQVDLRTGSASELPWPDESFDIVTQFTVFTSIHICGCQREIMRGTEQLYETRNPDSVLPT